MPIALKFLNGPNEGKIIPIKDYLLIGRGETVDLHIYDTKVSRKHAEIIHQNGTFVLRDIHSKNGTFLNNQRITTTTLQLGDEIQIGEFRFNVSNSDIPSDDVATECLIDTRKIFAKEKMNTSGY